jgi:hypothetical protein
MTLLNLPVQNALIDLGGLLLALLLLIGFRVEIGRGRLYRFYLWQPFSIGSAELAKPTHVPPGTVIAEAFKVLFADVLMSRVHLTCSRSKWAAHFATFWGFLFSMVSTILAYLTNPNNEALPFTDPVKLFGNAGGILLILGTVALFFLRYQECGSPWKISSGDFFIITLFLSGLTGMISQVPIYGQASSPVTGGLFWVHMLTVILLFLTMPFSKFNHALFKPVWLLFENISKEAGEEQLLPEPVGTPVGAGG